MDYDIRLEHSSGRPLAVVRRCASLAELSRVVPDACGIVWSALRGLPIPRPGRHVAVYLDDRINLEVGVELAAPFGGHGEVIDSSIPAGPVAATTHYGPYALLHQAHEAIRQWCGNHQQVLAGPCWEIYGHWQDEWNSDPTKICTEVYYLLTSNGSLVA